MTALHSFTGIGSEILVDWSIGMTNPSHGLGAGVDTRIDLYFFLFHIVLS